MEKIEALLNKLIEQASGDNSQLFAERMRCHNEINKLSHIPEIPRDELSFTLDLRVRKVCELLSLAYPHLKRYQSREQYLSNGDVFVLEDVCRALDHLHSLVDIEDGVGHIQIDCRDTVCLKALRYGASIIRKIISDNESLNRLIESYRQRAIAVEEELKPITVQKMEVELRAANLEIANLRERLRKQKEVADRWEDEVDTVNTRLIEERKMHSDSFYGKLANEVEKVLNEAAIPVCNGSDPMTLAERVQWCIDDSAGCHLSDIKEDNIRLIQERNNALEELHAQSVETEILKRELSELQSKGAAVYQDASTLYAAGLDSQAEIERLKKELEGTKQALSKATIKQEPSLLEVSIALWARDFDRLLTKEEAIEEALEFIELVRQKQS
jgi:hypothetical protein